MWTNTTALDSTWRQRKLSENVPSDYAPAAQQFHTGWDIEILTPAIDERQTQMQ